MLSLVVGSLEINEEPFARVEEHLTHLIFYSNDLPYNQIRAVIVALMFGVIYSD